MQLCMGGMRKESFRERWIFQINENNLFGEVPVELAKEFRNHAATCIQMSRESNDPEINAAWVRMADRDGYEESRYIATD